MKKFLLGLLFTAMSLISYSQCTVTATSSLPAIDCGQCVDLNAFGQVGSPVMDNNFNGGSIGSGWSSTPGGAVFTNPCDPSYDGGTYLWMGNGTAGAREVATTGFDLSCGGQVCFYLDFATQGGAAPCEGPDIVGTEGVYFEYSTDGGTTWNTLNYFAPNPGGAPGMITSWNQYCFILPPGAWTTNTMFHWFQPGNSGTCCDHWGIDDVQIFANDCNYYYDWAHLIGSPDSSYGGNVCPPSTTTYSVIYTNGINDTCSATITVPVLFPQVSVTATPDSITTCGGCTQLDASLTPWPPDSCCYTLDMQDSWGDGWNGGNLMVNVTGGPSLGPFSAAGSGSTVTFCVLDGQSFTLNYTSGAWEGENTYTLYDPTATPIFSDGPNPTTGNVFTTTASCSVAPPPLTWTWTGSALTAINDSTQTACPTTSGMYYVNVAGGGCSTDDSVYVTVNIAPPIPAVLTDSICSGQTYTFADGTSQIITSTTNYISTLVGAGANGCDSIVDQTIYLLPSVSSTENYSICSGTDYTFPDGFFQSNITANTSYVSTLTAVNGCDSLVTTNLTIVPNINVSLADTVCSGDPYTTAAGSSSPSVTATTVFVDSLTSVSGCDSVVTTTVDVWPVYNATVNTTICSGDNYTFPDGSIQTGIVAPVTQVSTLTTVNGCDSIITTNISIDPVYNITQNVNVCSGDPYTFPDGTVIATILSPTTYVSNMSTTTGCDSIITTNVAVDPVYSLTENVNVCSGNNYTFPDGFTAVGITSPMTHISNLTTGAGCDSVITTSVGIFPAYTSTTNATVCDGNTYTFADGTSQTITGPVTYVSTLTSVDGCDSLVTENVGIYPVYNLTETYTQCPGLNYTFPDGSSQTINNSTTHVSNLATTNGCDSIITTTVNVFTIPPFDIVISPNGCPGVVISIANNTPGVNCTMTVSGPGWLQNYTGCGIVTEQYWNAGNYNVTISMETVDGCPIDTTIINAFEVYPKPVAQFTWNPTEGTITDNIINFTNQSIGGTSYYWDFGDGSTSNGFHDSHAYQDSGHYDVELIIVNNYGCSDTANGTVIINEEFFIFVPNAFTPDGDMHNNIFLPIVSGHNPQKYTLYIFDRWGELLYESHNSDIGWPGTYKGSLVKSDVYVWKVVVWTFDNRRKEYIGHVTLLK